MTRVTTKGQVTIPSTIRSAMNIEAGDSVIFRVEGNEVVMIPVKRKSLTELYGVFHVDKRLDFAEERRIAQEHVANHVMGVLEDDDD